MRLQDEDLNSFRYDATIAGTEHHYRITQNEQHYGIEQDGAVIATVQNSKGKWQQLSGEALSKELLESICEHIEVKFLTHNDAKCDNTVPLYCLCLFVVIWAAIKVSTIFQATWLLILINKKILLFYFIRYISRHLYKCMFTNKIMYKITCKAIKFTTILLNYFIIEINNI